MGAGTARFVPNGTDTTYGAYLNPQEPIELKSNPDFTHLFSPLQIGSVTLKNRIVKSSAGSEHQDNNYWPTDKALAFYGEFCKSGIGMVCYESGIVTTPPDGMESEGGIEGVNSMDITKDEYIPAHEHIAKFFHDYDTPIIAQMFDMTMYTGSASSTLHVFAKETNFSNGHMKTTAEVQRAISQFVDAAERYWKAGYDGVGINTSCNHYFATYLSRFTNNERTDQYSGDAMENRARVVTEIIEGIRSRCGRDFIVLILMSGVEENLGNLGDNSLCISLEEACEFARIFERAGASCLHIRSETYGHHCAGFMPDILHVPEHGHTGYGTIADLGKHFGRMVGQYEGFGSLLEIAAAIKSAVSIPVGAMDPRVTPELIENAIADGKIDFILMTQPLLADMHCVEKLREGRLDEIAPCTRCMTCLTAPYDMGMPLYCRVNAALTRAFSDDMPEDYDPVEAGEKLNVMVIGGGPAGMEAARIAAQRGHSVTLYEKEGRLDLTMDELSRIKEPHERIQDHKNYLVRQLELRGVTVRTGAVVDAGVVSEAKPDAVIVAVGGLYSGLDVPGFDSVIPASALADGVGVDFFVILGAQFQGCEAAVNLARQGKRVSIVNTDSADEIYRNGATWIRIQNKIWLEAKGVRFYNNAVVQEIGEKGVTILTDAGLEVTLPADKVINAMPKSSNRARRAAHGVRAADSSQGQADSEGGAGERPRLHLCRDQSFSCFRMGYLTGSYNAHSALPVRVLHDIGERYPGVTIQVSEHEDEELVRLIVQGELHAGYGVDLPQTSQLELTQIATEPLCALVNRNHPLAGCREVTMKALAGECILSCRNLSRDERLLTEIQGQVGSLRRRSVDGSLVSMLEAVRLGEGISVGGRMFGNYNLSELVMVPITDFRPIRHMIAVSRHWRSLPEQAQRIIGSLRGEARFCD